MWLADRYDNTANGIGLAPCGATQAAEVSQLLGGSYENGPRRRTASYLASVLVDLAAIVDDSPDFYAEVVNEFLAVDITPEFVTADERRAQWRPDGPGTRLNVNVEYRAPLPSDGVAAAHFGDAAPPVPAWDAVALSSVVRNRHSVAATRALLREIGG